LATNDSVSQLNLREPERVDWDTAFASSKYAPPPPALGPDGKPIVYQGKVVEIKQSEGKGLDQGYLNYQVDLQFIGTEGRVRTWASTRTFTKKNQETGEFEPIKGNPNALAKLLKAAGVQAKPSTNAEYAGAVKLINGKAIPFTIDWEASNRETGEVVKGYLAFPDDPERPGQKKTILRKGDLVNEVDAKGNILGSRQIQSEILFANPRLKYFQGPK
jgi:hypothetical protein